MNTIITFSDKNYFTYGEPFLLSRKKVNSHIILYGPNLTNKQKSILHKHDIEHKKIDGKRFKTEMQFLKFELLLKNISDDKDGIAFLDFDTFFLKDISDIFEDDFALGITVRNIFFKTNVYRAYANGGVIFAKNTKESKKFCEYAIKVMTNGGDKTLPEYNKIFKTFEPGSNRPAHKVWSRKNLRWWVDQVFLSCFPYRYKKRTGKNTIKRKIIYQDLQFNIGLFSCDIYNKLDPTPAEVKNMLSKGKVYIVHLKRQGRKILNKIRRILQ